MEGFESSPVHLYIQWSINLLLNLLLYSLNQQRILALINIFVASEALKKNQTKRDIDHKKTTKSHLSRDIC